MLLRKSLVAVFAVSTLLGSLSALADDIRVRMSTNKGEIMLTLDSEKAPLSVNNFIEYANAGYYNGTIFHRVMPGFMIQGGGFNVNMEQKETRAPVKNEAENGLSNKRGTIAMARTNVVDSATSQFFINVVDNAFLDHGTRDFGYAVFGQVTAGMDIVDAIAQVETGSKNGHQNVPVEPVIIEKVEVVK